MDARSFSLDQLLRLSIQHGLITDYRISPSLVTLFRNDELLLEADPEEARIFLQGLLAGHRKAQGHPATGRGGSSPSAPGSGKTNLA